MKTLFERKWSDRKTKDSLSTVKSGYFRIDFGIQKFAVGVISDNHYDARWISIHILLFCLDFHFVQEK